MSEREIEDFLEKVEQGLLESQQIMLREKALHNQDVVIMNDMGDIVHVSAKEVLLQHPELQS